jgi:Na+-translocating ferredoxin:NAD+ oxidoreductase RnfE subunit
MLTMGTRETEIIGFWMAFSGWLPLLLSMVLPSQLREAILHWIEDWLRIPWFVTIVGGMLLCVIMMMWGGHNYYWGNMGRYPGYPMDLFEQ